jgi:hypothetical protein
VRTRGARTQIIKSSQQQQPTTVLAAVVSCKRKTGDHRAKRCNKKNKKATRAGLEGKHWTNAQADMEGKRDAHHARRWCRRTGAVEKGS